MRQPKDTYGGTTTLVHASLLDAAPSHRDKTMAHFYIGVDEIDAIAGNNVYPIVTFATPSIVDLLQYQNGRQLDVGQAYLPAQNYSQYRLVLNAASTQVVFTDGSSLPAVFKTNARSQSSANAASETITTTDAMTPGAVDVTVNVPFTFAANSTSWVAGDFNILESLTINNNAACVRPSMFVGDHGQLNGIVQNRHGAPVQGAVVVATGANGTVANTAQTDLNGRFSLHALRSGTYQLTIYNAYTTAAGDSIVASGQSTSATSVNGPTVTVTAGGSASAGIIND